MTGVNAFTYHNLGGWSRRVLAASLPLRPADVAGSATVGTAAYALPATGGVYVDPVNGVDTAAGTLAAPVKTFQKAITMVATNGTIVLRGGTYHEGMVGTSSVYAGHAVTAVGATVQNYPGEAVWFDGSSVVTGFVTDTTSVAGVTVWRKDSFTTQFDRSPTLSFGAADDPRPGWGFVNSSYPCAAWPDQVFVDGVQLTQVDALSKVATGKFFVDYATSKLYIGNNPSGKEIRASDLQTCMSALAAGVTLRGFGIRRYAPSMPHLGALKVLRSSCVLENLQIEDIATTGVSCQGGATALEADGFMVASHIQVRNVTTLRCGNMGFHANNADDITYYRVRAEYCNSEHFNYSPSSGGMKVSRLRGFKLTESVFSNNYSKGIWADESVYDLKIATCDFDNNEETGLILELCDTAIIANCVMTNTGAVGLNIFNTNKVRCWNNTLVGNGRLRGAQPTITYSSYRNQDINGDDRAPMTSGSTGRDTRYAFPDSNGMTWLITEVTVNNTVNAKSPGQALFGLEDFSTTKRAWQSWGPTMNGNFYNRVDTNSPAWEFIMANASPANPTVYFNLPSFVSGTGLDTAATGVDGGDALNADYTLKTAYLSAHANAVALPSDVAALVGKPAGTKFVGAWR